jgi:hypothetical protein
MKTLFTLFISCILLLLLNIHVQAQCVGPDLKFTNPTLVSGTALSEGAIYKFQDITPGIDCFIKLVKLNGGAALVSMETPGMGYGDAWQPIIDGPGTPAGNRSWIDWNISFKTTAGDNYAFPCLDITAIDVDGDNQTIGEFIQSDGHTSYTIPSPTLLTLTDLGNGRLEAQAPITNRTGIDTMAMDVRIGFLYNGKDSVQLSLGSTVLANPGGATQRLNCIYFKRITLNNYTVLPVKYVSFKASAVQKGVKLNWVTDNEINNSYFDVERSFDGSRFSSIGIVLDGLRNGSNTSYRMSDDEKSLPSREIAYYRLKQIDINGKFSYSTVVIVKLKTNNAVAMQVSPNPFNENLSIRFTAVENGNGVIRIQNVTGVCVTTRNIIFCKGDNTVQIRSLGDLSKGLYVAQVIENGLMVGNQKIIKY